jgi:hypothetical protein
MRRAIFLGGLTLASTVVVVAVILIARFARLGEYDIEMV